MDHEKKEVKLNDSITVVFKTYHDYDYEPDYLGTFGNDPKPWCIDRSRQVLLGEHIDEPEYPERLAEFDEMRTMSQAELTEAGKLASAYDEAYHNWNQHHGLEVLSDDVYVYHRYDNREYRYFYISENYNDETKEDKVKYMLEDHKRYERLLDGDWCYLGYGVEVWVEGIKVASESVWGIESDMSRSDKEEVWGDLLDQCFSNIEKKISDMVNALQMGFSSLPSKETIADLVKEIE